MLPPMGAPKYVALVDLQIYMPLTMVVFCSWVTFFLIKTEKGGEVPARTALGANSILSIVNIGFGGKSR